MLLAINIKTITQITKKPYNKASYAPSYGEIHGQKPPLGINDFRWLGL